MKELKIWLLYTNNSFQQMLVSRPTVIIFLLGKFLRVALFLVFLGFLFNGTRSIGDYTREQIVFFFLSFNLIDTLAQLFFREVYRFRALIISGGLDFVLVKPLNPLIRVLLGGADVLDLFMLIILSTIITVFSLANLTVTMSGTLLYLLLIANSLLLAAAFHIFVLSLGVLTTSVDHLISIYRDMTSMLRIPVDLYTQPIRFLLTFILPLGIMITFPAKAFLGILNWEAIIYSYGFGLVAFYLSLLFWNFAIKKYSSASS